VDDLSPNGGKTKKNQTQTNTRKENYHSLGWRLLRHFPEIEVMQPHGKQQAEQAS
jgi:hypothetical protein